MIIGFAQIFTVGWAGFGIAIGTALIEIYFFLCIFSLYKVLKEERLNSIPMQPLPAPARPYSDTQHSVDYIQHQHPSPYTQQPTTFNQYQDQAAVGYGQPMQPDDDSDIAKELPQKIRFSNWKYL